MSSAFRGQWHALSSDSSQLWKIVGSAAASAAVLAAAKALDGLSH